MPRKVIIQFCCILLLILVYVTNGLSLEFVPISFSALEFYNELQPHTLNTSCELQLHRLQQALENREEWSLKLVDSWAKWPAGILYGHKLEMGNYDECLNVIEPNVKTPLLGKYCFAKVSIVNLGICIPNECTENEISISLRLYLHTKFGLNLNKTEDFVSQCQVKERLPYEPIDWATIIVMCFLGLLVIASTMYDLTLDYLNKTPQPSLRIFSLRNNLRQLFKIHHTTTLPSNTISLDFMPCLHGIRSISLIWIIFLHCCLMLRLSPNINTEEIDLWTETAFSMFLQAGTVSVDTFLFLSGMLLTIVNFKLMARTNGQLNVPIMLLHRIIRLTPTLVFAVLFFMSLYRYVGDSPVWQSFVSSTNLCKETWWATLLYVQNYAAAGRMCLGHTWYLAVDMQLYILSPLALIVLWRWRRKGVAILIIFGLLMFACLFATIMIDELDVLTILKNTGQNDPEMAKLYYPTHERVLPWIVGIVFGFFLSTHNAKNIHLPKFIICLSWFSSLTIMLCVIFALYPKMQSDVTPLTTLGGAFYLSLSRLLWPIALCWIIFACLNGYGGPINDFLSSPVWQIISKLSYCMYIWHLPVVQANAGRSKVNTYFSNYDIILRFWSDFGISLCVSVLFYLIIEAPAMTIDKLLLGKSRIRSTQGVVGNLTQTTISQQQLCQ